MTGIKSVALRKKTILFLVLPIIAIFLNDRRNKIRPALAAIHMPYIQADVYNLHAESIISHLNSEFQRILGLTGALLIHKVRYHSMLPPTGGAPVVSGEVGMELYCPCLNIMRSSGRGRLLNN